MPLNNVSGPGGVGYGSPDPGDGQAATVRLGQNTLSDVARAHGLDPQELLKANPQITDPYQKLNAGQELSLPKNPGGTAGNTTQEGGATENFGGPQMSAGQDIEAVAFIVMMEATNSAQKDLQEIMNQTKAIDKAKSEWRSLENEVNSIVGAPSGSDAPTEANGGSSGNTAINALITEFPGKDLPKP